MTNLKEYLHRPVHKINKISVTAPYAAKMTEALPDNVYKG